MSAKVTDLIAQLLSGQLKKATITSLNTYEAIRYSLILGLDVEVNTRLVITNRVTQHLLESGHLTGHGIKNRKDPNPLKETDFSELPHVFKKPDKIIFIGKGKVGYRIIVEKRMTNYHRLILDYDTRAGYFMAVSYYNTNKKPLA